MFNIIFNLKKNKLFLKKKNKLNFFFKKSFSYIIFFENKFFKIYKKNKKYFKNLYLICKADFNNYKKKSNEELLKSYKYSIENFSEELLPVVDSLESILNSNFYNSESILEGVRLTLKIINKVFLNKNIIFILPKKGEIFNPYKHLAISKIFCEGQENNSIVNVLQKGYYIFERVLRPALVVVNKVN